MKRKLSLNTCGILYAFIHFSVEFCCFYYIYTRMGSTANSAVYTLLYDALAFVPQVFIGVLTDNFKKLNVGAIGALFIFTAMLLRPFLPSFLLLTVGNALVHVSGANATLRGAGGKLSAAGVFVSGGSLGIIAAQLYSAAEYPVLLPTVCITVSFVLMCVLHGRIEHEADANGFDTSSEIPVWLTVILVSAIICARSYVGYAIPTSWKKETWQTALLFFSMFAGKAAGGILADRFGSRKVGVLSLLLSMPFLIAGDRFMVISLIGVCFFSMTMAITLGVLVSRFPDMPGLSFGITTVALFAGSAPAFFVQPSRFSSQAVIVITLTLVAAVSLYLCTKKKGIEKNVNT